MATTTSDTREHRPPAPVAPPPEASEATLARDVPRIADGVELIGRFEDSGFKEPPYIARRADGQVVQMAPLLYALAEEIDGARPLPEIADRLADRIKRGVTGEMAEMLVEEKLRPLGIVAPKDGAAQAKLKKVDPLLALRFRTKVVPESVVGAITSVFAPLFAAPVVAVAVIAFVLLDAWLFGVHGISQSVRHVLYEPALLLMLLGGVVLATAFHEIGHASACRYGGAKPGVMGVGIYIVWPAFYTDITDAYRLGKTGRLRADLGGMYFNALFAVAVGGAYLATGFEPLLLLIVLQTFAVIQQSLPLLRLDGYYILSDLTGVPDILMRIKPLLASLIPGREPDPRVAELKPWVRVVVTAYVVTLVPVLGFVALMMLVHAPRVFATAYDSFFVHWDRVGPDLSAGRTVAGSIDLLQMVALALPALGLAYTASRISRRAGVASWRWSAGSPLRRGAVGAAGIAIAAFAGFVWWPHGEYRPIQPGEKGTIFGGLKSIREIPSGRPSLTVAREAQLGGAPTERSLERHRRILMQLRDPSARYHEIPGTRVRGPLTTPGDVVLNHDTGASGGMVATQSAPAQTTPTSSSATATPTQTTPTGTSTTPTQTQTTPTDTSTSSTQTTPTDTNTTPTDTTPTDTNTTPTDTTATDTNTTSTQTTP